MSTLVPGMIKADGIQVMMFEERIGKTLSLVGIVADGFLCMCAVNEVVDHEDSFSRVVPYPFCFRGWVFCGILKYVPSVESTTAAKNTMFATTCINKYLMSQEILV